MDLGKIIDEIVPWLILAGMLLPYLKSLKKRKEKELEQRAKSHVNMLTESRLSDGLYRAVKEPEAYNDKPVLPDEGVRATADVDTASPVENNRTGTNRRRALRKALIVGELLARRN